MNEGTMANASELETPAIEQQAPEVEDDGFSSPDLEADVIEGDDEEQAALAELFDIELDGETLKVPAKFKDAFLRNADYTQKSQLNADEKRQIAEERKQLEVRSKATDDELQARGILFQINGQLQQYQDIDWQRFNREDPVEAQAQYMRFQQLREAQADISGKLSEAEKTRQAEAAADFNSRIDQTRQFAQEKIKGWTPQLDREIETFAMSDLGLTPEEIQRQINPRFYRGLYLAFVGAKALAKQAAPRPAQTSVQPLTTVAAKSGASARKSLGEMSMEEYAAHRNRQEAAQRARAQR
ncbi:hypothetical protein [Shinella sp. JR1-6]|uniref:hypothetical protein n=1 Tax=Shinella sp. JR1-6 TaxID=2527671 RepID=UPI00102D60C2|nr:hypothetical protein [Shinella sp. JR1-6]TAA51048.1 hypothetical protein EXZ48_31995 [Shinella sp. JR1-6]